MFVTSGWYDDELSRVSAGWCITRRVGTAVWCDGNPAVLGFPDLPGGLEWGESRRCPDWLSPD